jgi:hypothetical protein
LRRIEIDRNDLGEGTAEIDEESEGRHCDIRLERLDCAVKLDCRFYRTGRSNHEGLSAA